MKNQAKPNQVKHWALSIGTAVIVACSVSIALAWTGPTATAPSGNINTPINVTATGQVKSGGFWAAAIGSDTGYCIGASCILAWPSIPWTVSTTTGSIYYTGGNVGIGTASPVATLDIGGYARLATQTSAPFTCDALHKGAIALAGNATICTCDGSSWNSDASGAACVWSVVPGSQNYTTAGTYTFTVPSYNSLTVKVWGGGGGGAQGFFFQQLGGPGGQSSFNGTVMAGGGGGGSYSAIPGAGGTSSGGSTNISGNSGFGSTGGSAPYGGTGGAPGANNGSNPGGGGGGYPGWGGGGGSGGYSSKIYTVGQLIPGATITIIVGNGGAPGYIGYAGAGGIGGVYISWN